MNNLFYFTKGTSIVLQPYGSIISNKETNNFFVVDNAATAIVMNLLSTSRAEMPFLEKDISSVFSMLNDGGVLTNEKEYSFSPDIVFSSDQLTYVRADIEVTNRCNLSCVHCYAEVNKSKFELSLNDWKTMLFSLKKKGLRAVLFSGGEPFIRKDFINLVRWASCHFIVEINTNGRYINDVVARELSLLNLKTIQISLDSLTAEHHDSLRGKRSHEYAVNALKTLSENNVPIQISTVATAKNEKEFSELIKYAKSIGASLNITPISKSGFAKNIPDIEWEESYKSTYRYHSATEESRGNAVSPLCQSAIGYIAISFTGDLKPCNQRESYFAPTENTSLVERETKWWSRDFGSTNLGKAVYSLPFNGIDIPIKQVNTSVCDLQNYFLTQESNKSNS